MRIWLTVALVLCWLAEGYAKAHPCTPHHPCTPTPTPFRTPTKIPTAAPPISTPTSTATPIPATPTSTPTATAIPFAPLVHHPEVTCPTGTTNWYGEGCKNYLGIFGHDRIGQTTRNLMTFNKGAAICGVAIDRSRVPNAVYGADCAHNRILVWKSIGTCSDGSPCTWSSECPPPDACVVNPLKNADFQIPRPDVKDGACNGDDNIGFRGPADGLCLMNLPDNSNMAESFYSNPLEVDAQGNLYVDDIYNGRFVRFNDPIATDSIIDDSWIDLRPLRTPDRAYKGAPGAGVDGSGGVWFADPGNARVVHAPAGSHSWDVCLGQPDCATKTWDGTCASWSTGKPVIPPSNLLCSPVVARVKPSTGELYVLDAGYDGWQGNYGGSIRVYAPPFKTGMLPSRIFSPQLTQVTWASDGSLHPYAFRGYDFRFDDQGFIWVSDDADNAVTRNRLLKLDDQGNILSFVGPRSADEIMNMWPGQCGDPMANYYWWGGGFGFDLSGSGMIAALSSPNLFTKYTLPAYPWTASDGTICPPHSSGGLLDNSTFWGSPSLDTLDGPNSIYAVGGQLIVRDVYTKVWNDYTHKPWGSPADFETRALADHWSNYSHMTSDDAGHLWWTQQERGIFAAKLPLTPSSTSLSFDHGLYWADDGTPVAEFGTRLPNNHVLFDPRGMLLVADPLHGRILGILNYRDVDTPGAKLYVNWVQGQPDKASVDGCNHGGAPTSQTLCSGGQITLNPHGDLFVNDMAGSNWDTSCGNNRVLGYLAADIVATWPTSGTVTFANLSAKRIIRPGGPSYTTPGLCGVYQASTISFDQQGRLWMSGHGGMGYSPTPYSFWEIVEYDDPLVKQTPDHYLRIPMGYTPDIEVDGPRLLMIGIAQVYSINPDEWLTPLP